MEKLYVATKIITKGSANVTPSESLSISLKIESEGVVGVMLVFDGLDSLLDAYPDADYLTVEIPE